MKYWFISDDAFFLYGLNFMMGSEVPEAIFFEVDKYFEMPSPDKDDVVFLAVNDNYIRSRVLNMSAMWGVRLAIMLDVPLERSYPGTFPCLLSKKIDKEKLIKLLNLAHTMPVRKEKHSVRELNIFLQLSCGETVGEIRGLPYLSRKSIYRIKRRVLQNYGLTSCNSIGVLICRDMLTMTHAMQ